MTAIRNPWELDPDIEGAADLLRKRHAASPAFKLLEPVPPPTDERCVCLDSPIYLTDMAGLTRRILRCGTCNGDVDPAALELTSEATDATAYWSVLAQAFGSLELDSAEFEQMAVQELLDPDGATNLRGYAARDAIATCTRRQVYLRFFQPHTEAGYRAVEQCPRCGAALDTVAAPKAFDCVCTNCMLGFHTTY